MKISHGIPIHLADYASYRNMSISDAIEHTAPQQHQAQKSFFTMTNSQDIDYLPDLAEQFPNYDFNIGAYSYMGPKLLRLAQYPNIKLYPVISKPVLKQLIAKADAYLDINKGDKLWDIISQFANNKKPIIGESPEENVTQYNTYYHINNLINLTNKLKNIR